MRETLAFFEQKSKHFLKGNPKENKKILTKTRSRVIIFSYSKLGGFMADVKRMVETTLDRATGWTFGKYPSSKGEDTLYINIQYPSKIVHSDFESDKQVYDFSRPNFISIRRCGQNLANILLSKDTFIDSDDKKEKTSYRLSFRIGRERFQAIETPDGEVLTQGDFGVLMSVLQDDDFKHYVAFAPVEEKNNQKKQLPKWDLNKMMKQARPSRED